MKRKPADTPENKNKGKNCRESNLVNNYNSKPDIDLYEKFIEISYSIAAEKQVFGSVKYLKHQVSSSSTLTVNRLQVKDSTKGLKSLPYAVRRYVFQRANALSKTSTIANVSLYLCIPAGTRRPYNVVLMSCVCWDICPSRDECL